jgi:hypothetical protein
MATKRTSPEKKKTVEPTVPIVFDDNANPDQNVSKTVSEFLTKVPTLETEHEMPIIIFQDGLNSSYYIKCNLSAQRAANLLDLDARIDLDSPESFRSNRNLLLQSKTYQKMQTDAEGGREFNDIIVEYNRAYNASKPLKVWGGQHRSHALSYAQRQSNRYHGFRVYFNLSKGQRTEVALISNTNINVSNDTFDRMLEETVFGDTLRQWCQNVGFLVKGEDFPDVGSTAERITVKKARSFIVNFYIGKSQGGKLSVTDLDKNVFDPYLTETGITVDSEYRRLMESIDILKDKDLLEAGKKFLQLHNAQFKSVVESKGKVKNIKAYRNKAFVESVLCGWSYVAGLLQKHKARLDNHYRIPKTSSRIPDPLNAGEMSKFKHDKDDPTYRGLGTRSSLMDRQRVAELFLLKSAEEKIAIDEKLMRKAVSRVIGLTLLKE